MNYIELLAILGTAFMIGFGHCIGMCGGIVIAYSTAKIDEKASWAKQSFSHLAYNFGRITTYIIMGALFGLLGKVFAFTMTTKGILFITTGMLMIIAGFSIIGGGKFLNSANWSISKQGWFQNSFKALLISKTPSSFYILGMLNGLIPCGPVYAFAIVAASTANPFYGAMVMFIFGLGTMPSLLFLGSLAKLIQRGGWRTTMTKIGALMIMLYGAWTLLKGYNFISHPEMMGQKMEKMQQQYHIPELTKDI
ncbi:MAG: sulfite exporter TauE/SafE family protein [Sulfurovaceae bacterium]